MRSWRGDGPRINCNESSSDWLIDSSCAHVALCGRRELMSCSSCFWGAWVSRTQCEAHKQELWAIIWSTQQIMRPINNIVLIKEAYETYRNIRLHCTARGHNIHKEHKTHKKRIEISLIQIHFWQNWHTTCAIQIKRIRRHKNVRHETWP